MSKIETVTEVKMIGNILQRLPELGSLTPEDRQKWLAALSPLQQNTIFEICTNYCNTVIDQKFLLDPRRKYPI